MRFDELKLSDYMLEALKEQGFEEATEIQGLTIPHILEGKDTLGLSQTGSGKTYAFGIPAIEMVDTEERCQQILVICPTRELATQSTEELRKLTEKKEGVKIVPIFGGASMERQIQAIKKNARIVVGTPGRLMDHLRRKTLKLDKIKMIVLDEADEMLNMGFREDIETILKASNDTHQTVMFSATMPKEIMHISKAFMKDPITVKSSVQDNPQEFIDQFYVQCQREKKLDTLLEIYQKKLPKTSIIFCNTKRMTDMLAKNLNDRGKDAFCIHGDMRQSARRRVMDEFKANGGILVATDVAARGIDVKNVDIVVNYDFPANTDYYVHRIGRTARAGKEGMAITIINNNEQLRDMKVLMKETKNQITQMLGFSSDLIYVKPGSHTENEEVIIERRGGGQRRQTASFSKKTNKVISIKEFEKRDASQSRGKKEGFGNKPSTRFGENMYREGEFGEGADKPKKYGERKFGEGADKPKKYGERKFGEGADKPKKYGERKFGEGADRPKKYGERKFGEGADKPKKYGERKFGEGADRPKKYGERRPDAGFGSKGRVTGEGTFKKNNADKPAFENREGEGQETRVAAPFKRIATKPAGNKRPFGAKKSTSSSRGKVGAFDQPMKRKKKD